jgi:enamine deaminase RidA (YjgF/YER057c/UK114 family)
VPGFNEQPKVIDAPSELLAELLGESGLHARSGIGVAELPRDAAVEIEFVVAYLP